jgi:hypothetical protein
MQLQSPLTLAALMSWSPRPILTTYEPFNSMCEICEEMPADDGPAFLQCSFFNLSFCNTHECPGSAGGAILSKRDAENEQYEWACPKVHTTNHRIWANLFFIFFLPEPMVGALFVSSRGPHHKPRSPKYPAQVALFVF